VAQFLTSFNAREIVSCKSEEFELPNHPEYMVRVKQLPIDELKRLSRVATKDTSEGHKAQLELIAKSIVNEDGTPVFTDELVADLKQANGPIFNDLMIVVGKANNKKKSDIEKDLDDAEKN
jgi:hypothetical protein